MTPFRAVSAFHKWCFVCLQKCCAGISLSSSLHFSVHVINGRGQSTGLAMGRALELFCALVRGSAVVSSFDHFITGSFYALQYFGLYRGLRDMNECAKCGNARRSVVWKHRLEEGSPPPRR